MSELIGDAELQVGTDLAPLDRGLADAKAKTAKAVAELQAMLDKLALHIRDDGFGGSGALAGLSAGAATMASSWDTALASVRASLKDTDRAIGHTAEVTVAASEVEVAAIDKVTRAYLEQAAAARAAADAGEVAAGRALGVDALALAGLRGGGGSRTGAAFATREQRGGGQGLTAAELAAIAGAGIEGVRGKGHAGSRVDPLVVVLEAGRYTPLGGMSAAVGYQGLSGAATTTVAQGGTQGGRTTLVSSSSTPGDAPGVVPLVGGDERSRAIRDAALSAGVAKLAEAIERPLTSPGRPGAAPEAVAAVLAARKAGEGATPGGVIFPTGVRAKGSGSDKAVPVVVTGTDPKVTQAEGAATAAALADLAGREIAPGQRAKAGPAYRAAYEALGYTVASRVPGGPARLYAAGGQPGTGSYGLTAEAAALAAAHGGGSAGGGGGVPPWLMPLLWGRSGGGGGGGRLGGLLTAGGALAGFGSLGSFAGFGPEHLLMTAGGIVGSGVAALGGGALLAGGALGKIGVGQGSDLAVMKSTIADTGQLYKAYEAVTRAVRVYGKNSEQAKVATAELNATFLELGNTAGVKAEAGVAHAAMALNEYWDKATSNARVQASKILTQVLELGRAYIPLVAHAAEQNFSLINTGLKPLFEWLKGPEGMGIFLQLENEFRTEIPAAMKALDMGFQFFAKTIAAVAPYTGALIRDLDAFFTKMDNPAEFAKWEAMMFHMIGDFHVWGNFLKALGGTVVDLFNKDAHTGEGIIEVLTRMLDKVRAWENSTKGAAAIRNIFTLHKEEVIALLEALSLLVAPFKEVYVTLAPPLVKSVTGITEAFAFLLTKIEQLGSVGKWLVGLTLVAAKLKVLGPLLRAVAVETNVLSAAEDKNALAVTADAEGNLRLAASEGAVGAGGALSGAANDTSLLGKVGIGGGGLSGDLKSTLVKGGLEAGGGALVANIAATALGIHGTSSAALTAAGAGAGLGFAFGGPFGAAVGAGLGGGLVEAINLFTSHAPNYGKKFAEGFAAPLQANLARSGTGNEGAALTAALAKHHDATEKSRKALHEYEKEHEEAEQAYKPSASEAPKYHAEVRAGYNKLFNKNFTNEAHEAATAGELMKKAFGGVPHKTTWAFTTDLISQLRQLSGEARNSAAETMLLYARELEAQGNLPKGAVAKVLKSLEDTPGFAALGEYFKEHALTTSAQVAAAFSFTQAKNNLTAFLEKTRTEWGLFNVDPTVTGKDWMGNVATEMGDLRRIVATATGSTRDEALLKLHELEGGTDETLNRMVGSVKAHFAAWSPAMKAGIGPALSQSETELSGFVGSVNTLMQSGVLSAQTGAKLITEATNAYLEALGAKPIPIVGVAVANFLKQFPEISKIPHNGKLVPLEGHAHGGLIQIGRPGEAGHDTVPLNVGGLPIAVAPGEQVAVFNRHQLPIVNAALAPIGGLPGLFDSVTTPNYMASGGIVAPHVGGRGAIADIVRAALGDVAHAADAKLGKARATSAKGGAGGITGHFSGTWVQVMKAIAKEEGWNLGDWEKIVAHESGGRVSAKNPTSTAFGLGQLLQENYETYGGGPGSTGVEQIIAMARYIKAHWRNPTRGWESEERIGTYTLGGLLSFAHGGLLSGPLASGLGFSHGSSDVHKAKRKTAAKLPPGVRFNPFGPIPPVKTSWSGEEAWGKLTKIMAPGGGLAAWIEMYGLDEAKDELALSKAPHAGAFVVQPNALEKAAGITLPYEDPGNVQMRAGQINLLSQREYGVLNYLTEGWNLSQHVLSAAHAGIQERNKAIADLKARIKDNLKKIKELRDAIKRQEDTLKKLPTGKHATAASRAQAAKLHKEIAAEHGQIKALEEQNAKLGGSPSEIGTGGNIGALVGERTELTNTRTSTEGFVQEIGGASGRGGKRGEAQATVAKIAQQLVELGETPVRLKEATLEAGASAGEGGGESAAELAERKAAQTEEKNKFLKEEVHSLTEALRTFGGPGDIGVGASTAFAAAAAQGGILGGLGPLPLPYAGSFGAGGIIPGPVGVPALAVVHGQEEVVPAGGKEPTFHQHIEVNTLHPGDPTTLTAIGKAATRGIGYQGLRKSKRWKPGI